MLVLRFQEERILLLIFGAPDLEHRERCVAHDDLPYLDLRACRMHDLLHHIAVAAGALVVDALDRVLLPKLHAGADHAVHLLFHLSIAALYCVEIQFGNVLALDHGRGSSTAHADAVGRSADLDHEHALLCFRLYCMTGVHLAHASGKHDRLEPFPALAVGKPEAEGTGKALDHRFAEFVAVVRCAVACLDLDLERRGKIIRIRI